MTVVTQHRHTLARADRPNFPGKWLGRNFRSVNISFVFNNSSEDQPALEGQSETKFQQIS